MAAAPSVPDPPIVVVSGVPRSGTSLAMQVLAAAGIPVLSDGRRVPDASNPRGYFEHERVKALARDPDGDGDADRFWAGAAGHAVKVVHALVTQLPRGPRYRVVWMTRPVVDVVASQDAMLARAGEGAGALPADRVADVLGAQADAARAAIAARDDCDVLDVDAHALCAEPETACATIARFVRGTAPSDGDVARMARVVAPRLFGRVARSSGAGGYTPAMTVTAHETVGPVRIEVDHRAPNPEGGPTLRVRAAADDREVLRFDCFARGAHWHLDPSGPDTISRIPRGVDAIDWTLAELRGDGAGYVARAGIDGVDGGAFAAAVDGLEPALRNGPPRFDELERSVLRSRTGEKWTQFDEDVLPLWVADMDFEVADPIRRALQRALDTGDLGYPWHPQPTAIPGLFADRMQRLYGWHVDPRRVELVTEVVQAMYVAVHQLTEPGDGIIVQRPIYPPFVGLVEKLGRTLVDNALREAEVSYLLDVDLLREQAQHAKILLLCNPHNPTGRVMRREELQAIGDIAVEHDLVIVSDEIHQELVYPGAAHVPIASLSPEVEARTITIASTSKAFNIAGLRCAVTHFGSHDLRRRFLDFPRHLRGGLNSLGILATEAAWAHSDPWLEDVRAYLLANRDFTAEFVRSEMPGVPHTRPEATYLAWLDCRELELPMPPAKFFLEHARVGLSEGTTFGPMGEGFCRLNFSTSRAILEDALGRMAKALRSR